MQLPAVYRPFQPPFVKKKMSLKKILLIAAGIVVLMLLVLFALRNTLLNRVAARKTKALSERMGAGISYSAIGFDGLWTVRVDDFCIVPPDNDTLVRVQEVSIGISPLSLLKLRLRFEDVKVSKPLISLHRTGTKSNYLFLLDKRKTEKADTTRLQQGATDYAARVSGLFRAFFGYTPSSVEITDFTVAARINNHHFSFSFPELTIRENYFKTLATVTDDSLSTRWQIAGILNPNDQKAAISIRKTDSLPVQIPYIHARWKTLIAFDSISMRVNFARPDDSTASIDGNAVIHCARLNNPRISPDDVTLEQSKVIYRLNFSKNSIELDSSSIFSFNRVAFHPYVRYDAAPDKKLTIRVNEPAFGAQDFFSSLPNGLFPNLEGIKVKGSLGFHLNFEYAVHQPDSLIFGAALTSDGFSVQQFGKTSFTFINEPFLYTAYEKGQPVRQFMVGPENPDFRTIDRIPASLKNAIMTSEDGAFYYHNGFIPEALRASIITNIKQKRFARGGSTISMQLVKNVFLTRNKIITRKLEEMLITWLIESQRLVSKDRMFEVYLNIIETGPMVYGVNEAARFYFSKDVSKLTLAESIYLASIVPKPKWFRYSFDENGNLREHLQSYYELVSGKMLRKEWITQEEYDNLLPQIELKGPAREMVLPVDSIPAEEEADPDFI